jgi:hypothetical protein
MTDMPELPKPGFDSAGDVVSPGVPSYRANLPTNLGDLADERETLTSEAAATERIANVFMTLGLISGFGSFLFPIFTAMANLGGSPSITGAVNSFVGTIVICVLFGIVFGAIAASIRSRAKSQRSRIRALNDHEILLKRQVEREPN